MKWHINKNPFEDQPMRLNKLAKQGNRDVAILYGGKDNKLGTTRKLIYSIPCTTLTFFDS